MFPPLSIAEVVASQFEILLRNSASLFGEESLPSAECLVFEILNMDCRIVVETQCLTGSVYSA